MRQCPFVGTMHFPMWIGRHYSQWVSVVFLWFASMTAKAHKATSGCCVHIRDLPERSWQLILVHFYGFDQILINSWKFFCDYVLMISLVPTKKLFYSYKKQCHKANVHSYSLGSVFIFRKNLWVIHIFYETRIYLVMFCKKLQNKTMLCIYSK